MTKQNFLLLFTFLFSINLFAQSHDIHRDISDIKLQIQEIKLLDARDEREKKLEKLEKKIDDLDSKFNQNNIDKKDIEKSFDNNKDIIDRQDKRIDDIGINLNYWGIGFSLIAIFTGIAVFLVNKNYADSAKKEAKAAAQKELKEWIDKKAENEFKLLVNKAKDDIQSNADIVLNEIKEETLNKFDLFVNSLEKSNTKDNKYNYSDFFKLVISNYKENKIEEALLNIEKAITLAESEKEQIQSLLTKALLLGQMGGKSEEAIEVYDEVIRRFKDSKENGILEKVASALYNKGGTLGQMAGKSEEAIEVYDEVIRRFKDSKENGILEQVASALHNKGVKLGQMGGKSEEAIEVYDEVIRRFKDSKENGILEKVASTLVNKIEINLILGNINSKEDLDLYFNLVKENKEKISLLEMLQIFEKAKDSNQDDEIKDWQIKFKDVKLENWSFFELKIWAETFKSEEKERLLRYINIFENHNKTIEGK